MTEPSHPRESLSLRINSKIKQRYENRILEKFGTLAPYAGTELERELRVVIGDGELSKLVDTTHELARSLDETPAENKNPGPDRGGDSEVVGYRIHSEVRNALKEEAQTASDVTYASELVESVMQAYANGDQIESKVAARLERIQNSVDSQTSDKDAVTRRTESIIEAVTPTPFTLDDFNEAVDQEATGISSGEYARKEYLPRVLEEAGYTYHPNQSTLFVPIGEIDLSEQDLRDKPPVLRDDDDIREIILNDFLESAETGNQYTLAAATATLGEGVTHGTVRNTFEQIASQNEGIKYDQKEDHLYVKSKGIKSIAERHKEFDLL